MQVQQPKAKTVAPRRISGDAREVVRRAANGYIVGRYPFGCLGGEPRKLVGKSDLWIVPVVLTSPGYGAVGDVGMVAVAAHNHEVVGGTPRREIAAAIKKLKEVHGDALEAAFDQARTV